MKVLKEKMGPATNSSSVHYMLWDGEYAGGETRAEYLEDMDETDVAEMDPDDEVGPEYNYGGKVPEKPVYFWAEAMKASADILAKVASAVKYENHTDEQLGKLVRELVNTADKSRVVGGYDG